MIFGIGDYIAQKVTEGQNSVNDKVLNTEFHSPAGNQCSSCHMLLSYIAIVLVAGTIYNICTCIHVHTLNYACVYPAEKFKNKRIK